MSKSISIITQHEDVSIFSGRRAECRHHLIFGGGLRKKSEMFGLWIPLTNDEHNLSSSGTIYQIHGNIAAERLSKIAGQLAFERDAAITYCLTSDAIREDNAIHFKGKVEQTVRDIFMDAFGKSYI